MNRSRSRAVVALLAVAVMAALISIPALTASQSKESHQDHMIKELEKALAETTDAETEASIEEKLRIAKDLRDEELDAKAKPVDAGQLKQKQDKLKEESRKVDESPLSHGPWAGAGDGFIVEGAKPPLSGSEFRISNNWFMNTSAASIRVAYAGVSAKDQSQGMLIVMDEGAETGFRRVGTFATPGRNGAIRVTGAEGLILTLLAHDGTNFKFDMASLSYK